MPLDEQATIPLVYVKDAVEALIEISEVEEKDLARRTYGLGGFSPTAGALAEAVRTAVPDAEITFRPDPRLLEIVNSWPWRIDGSEAMSDWGWKERFGLAETVGDFVSEIRAHPDWP